MSKYYYTFNFSERTDNSDGSWILHFAGIAAMIKNQFLITRHKSKNMT